MLKDTSDVLFTETTIVLVINNLNAHKQSTRYDIFKPADASCRASRVTTHYMPKHSNCLNMDDIESAVLSHQCPDRRIPDRKPWSVKLLYPSIQ